MEYFAVERKEGRQTHPVSPPLSACLLIVSVPFNPLLSTPGGLESFPTPLPGSRQCRKIPIKSVPGPCMGPLGITPPRGVTPQRRTLGVGRQLIF